MNGALPFILGLCAGVLLGRGIGKRAHKASLRGERPWWA